MKKHSSSTCFVLFKKTKNKNGLAILMDSMSQQHNVAAKNTTVIRN